MYHLCFATFMDMLMLNQNHRSHVGRVTFVNEFLAVFEVSLQGYSPNVIGYLLSRSRNPSKILMKKLKVGKMEDSTDALNYFVGKHLIKESDDVKSSMISLVKNSENISCKDKDKLIDIINNDITYNFLKEVFYFTIENTVNIDLKIKTLEDLQKAIINTDNNAKLEKLCLVAFDMKNESAMNLCFEKMTNSVHISRVIEYAVESGFHNDEIMQDFIDKMISKISNNVYLDRIFKTYLSKEEISNDDKIQFIDRHIHQIANNKYLFDILKFLYENNFKTQAIKYMSKLTNDTYTTRFQEFIGSIDKT